MGGKANASCLIIMTKVIAVQENTYNEKKSLRVVTGKTANFEELAKDCVSFANVRGGNIVIGIEDTDELPPEGQTINENLPARIQKRISELTINTGIAAELKTAENGGSYILIRVHPSVATIASTTDGKYYYRISDTSVPLPPDELMRLLTDKPSFIWETKQVKTAGRNSYDREKMDTFITNIRNSPRVSSFVKNKTPEDLLDYYLMAEGGFLTNLGVLWVGKRNDRAKLSYAPVIQFLKYDENGSKINKIVWDDFSLNPAELIEAVWEQIADWKEGVEIADGMFRKFIPNYEEAVIRELITNALVHRPFTIRGDIFINLFPDRLEITNPGLLPLGVTPANILHKTVRRNQQLAQVFYDLKLMEREGSGFDKIYETLLVNGKQPPETKEAEDSVTVIIRKRIIKAEIVSFLNRINDEYQLNQREVICLSLLAQYTALSALEFAKILGLQEQHTMKSWLGKLISQNLVTTRGKTKATEYFVNPQILQKVQFKGKTTLRRIEIHRLRELIYQDLLTYPGSTISDINERIGSEVSKRKIKAIVDQMRLSGELISTGTVRWTRYSINKISSKK
jgi:ATP-dependent DNA helicase RecG